MTDHLPPDEVLRSKRSEILSTFIERARVTNADARLSDAGIVDHVPDLLSELADALETGRTSIAPARVTARQHATTRWHQGMDLGTLIREYSLLRACVVESIGPIGADELAILDRFFTTSMADAAQEFATRLESYQSSLSLLSEAGAVLASTSDDYRQLLQALAALCVRRLADCCAVYLSEGPHTSDLTIEHRSPEKAALVRRLYEQFPASPDAPYGSHAVLRAGRTEVVRDANDELAVRHAQSPEHLSILREIGAVSWMIVPLRVSDGPAFGVMALVNAESRRNFSDVDVSLAEELARRAALVLDHARLFEAARRERARAEVATRAKDEFLAVVSHELRTPLNAILGWTRMLLANDAPADKVTHALQVIERNASSQAQLIGDLLDVSRIVTGNVRLEIGSVEISNVVEMAIESIRPAAAAKSIVLDAQLDEEAGVVRGDPVRLQQIVWNLLTNAVKFTPKRGRVTVCLARVDSDVEIAVEDTGEGIDPSVLPAVFERFRQEDGSSTRSVGGLGLGLAIARHLVELHGGTITARSPGKGQGSVLTVRIPLSPLTTLAVTRPVMHATEHASRPQNAAKVAGMRVLVVDDDVDARELLETLFTSCAIETRTAATVSEGFDEFLRFRPDVVLSDIGLPDADGYALARRIRALPNEAGGHTPLIALTAFSSSQDRTRARVEGFSAHITKPVQPASLLDVLASFRFRES